MDLLTSVFSNPVEVAMMIVGSPFYVGALYIFGRAKIGRRVKWTAIMLSPIASVIIDDNDPFGFLMSLATVFFLCLWLQNIGILRPEHSIAYGYKMAKLRLIKQLLTIAELEK